MSFKKMLWGLLPLGLLAVYGAAIDLPATASFSPSAVPTDATYAYGTGDGLQLWQYDVLSNLQFPQTYAALTDRLGFPDRRSADGLTDYYQLPMGGWVAVQYDSSGAAINYSAYFGG